jgi:dihydrofolate reductase
MKVKFTAISAIGKNREIGLNGKLPWSMPDEYAHYKKTVRGHHVLVGRKNFELNEDDFQDSHPIVLSRDPNFSSPKALCFNTMEQVIEYADANQIAVVYVIGGAQIYELTLPYLSEFLCSVVDYAGPADTYFPQYLSYEWEVCSSEIHDKWTLYLLKKRPDF